MSYFKSLKIKKSHSYMNQHIKNFNIKFENIPMMTVIAGINGIGKTTLLTAISDQLESSVLVEDEFYSSINYKRKTL